MGPVRLDSDQGYDNDDSGSACSCEYMRELRVCWARRLESLNEAEGGGCPRGASLRLGSGRKTWWCFSNYRQRCIVVVIVVVVPSGTFLFLYIYALYRLRHVDRTACYD
jgi:hypothetical protein